MPRRVAWFIEAPVERLQNGGFTSKLASARYRCLIPARELRALGVECSIFSNLLHADPARIERELQQRDIDTVVIGKMIGPSLIELARNIDRRRRHLIADFCDDFFDDPRQGDLYRELARLADRLVASTAQMAAAIRRSSGRSSVVIPDPFEGPRGEPTFLPRRERVELLWFGNAYNVDTLRSALPQLSALSERQPIRLTVVTALNAIKRGRDRMPPNFALNFVEWSPEELWRQLSACDAVIIPSLATPHYLAKSPNRLVEAIWAGRAVAAEAIPSYREFRDVCRLGENVADGIAWMLENPDVVAEQIAAGQALIAKKYAPAVIAAQWLDCLQERADAAKPPR